MSTDSPSELWQLWKRSHEALRSAIVADVIAHSELTEPEFSVLIHLHDAGGSLRQNALGQALAWDRTRLSHLVSRMETRGTVARRKLTNGVDIELTPTGRRHYEEARPHLDTAVQEHLLDRLDEEDTAALTRVLRHLSGARRPPLGPKRRVPDTRTVP
ncbi:MarR family winged helix-turn-helix transcriptional regulator [Curtobacterium sp. MCBD17_040]|uniref:MarR family winged helix-turn-helix transcriptional regulator n=1 Tax=Curtobacterium sp. MCBD17_040 TaxID=2175674 RepID=UPI000DA97531